MFSYLVHTMQENLEQIAIGNGRIADRLHKTKTGKIECRSKRQADLVSEALNDVFNRNEFHMRNVRQYAETMIRLNHSTGTVILPANMFDAIVEDYLEYRTTNHTT